MSATGISRRLLAGLGVLAAVGAAGCSANPASHRAAGPGTVKLTSPTAAAPASSPPATASAAATDSGAVRNLVVTSAVRSELIAVFVAYRRLLPSEVAGTVPGSVYYADDPATGTYWALARFEPSRTDSLSVRVSFQDGGAFTFFRKAGTGAWQAQGGGMPPVCSELRFFPATVLKAWSLQTNPPATGCPA